LERLILRLIRRVKFVHGVAAHDQVSEHSDNCTGSTTPLSGGHRRSGDGRRHHRPPMAVAMTLARTIGLGVNSYRFQRGAPRLASCSA
jgi:hypothetical protein